MEKIDKTKIFELLRGLQKEAEAFDNDYDPEEDGKLEVEDFCNTICYYCSEIREVLSDE